MAILMVHGGAGWNGSRLDRDGVAAGLQRALDAGLAVLSRGARAAAVAAVRALEDDPLFNAGSGAVRTAEGGVELDAGVMSAPGLRTGGVAMMTDSANPVLVADALLEEGRHVLLAGAGASRYAREHGLQTIDPERLRAAARGAGTGAPGGTVGAVCRDPNGEVAVAVSTGGVDGKLPGRIGDSAICGAGFYADSPGAACATGEGEAFIRILGCHRAVELLAAGMEAQAAAAQVIEELATRVHGWGGIILVDAAGRPGVAHNSAGMPWAWRTESAAASW